MKWSVSGICCDTKQVTNPLSPFLSSPMAAANAGDGVGWTLFVGVVSCLKSEENRKVSHVILALGTARREPFCCQRNCSAFSSS